MNDAIGRRGFLGRTAALAAGAPLMLQGNLHAQQAVPPPPKQFKKIGVEEHWTALNVIEAAGRTPSGTANRQADLDAIRLGYQTLLLGDGIRPVNLAPGDGERAVAEMAAAGVDVVG